MSLKSSNSYCKFYLLLSIAFSNSFKYFKFINTFKSCNVRYSYGFVSLTGVWLSNKFSKRDYFWFFEGLSNRDYFRFFKGVRFSKGVLFSKRDYFRLIPESYNGLTELNYFNSIFFYITGELLLPTSNVKILVLWSF